MQSRADFSGHWQRVAYRTRLAANYNCATMGMRATMSLLLLAAAAPLVDSFHPAAPTSAAAAWTARQSSAAASMPSRSSTTTTLAGAGREARFSRRSQLAAAGGGSPLSSSSSQDAPSAAPRGDSRHAHGQHVLLDFADFYLEANEAAALTIDAMRASVAEWGVREVHHKMVVLGEDGLSPPG